jgi:phage terminase large subunit-like protein
VTAAPVLRDRLAAAIEQATRDLAPHERVVVAERVARELARRRRRTRYPSPGALAHAIDPLAARETPALELIDAALVRATLAMEGGRGARVAVAMPPQEGKSRRCTIAFPLWVLLRNPDLRVGIASFDSEVAATFSREVRNWIAAYGSGTALNPRPLADDLLGISLRGDSTSVSRFGIAGHHGGVVAVGMKGGLTGRPLDVLIVDDPYKDREQADSADHRRKVWEWWSNVAVPRLPSAALVVLVQTRWHPDDLFGAVLAQERALPEHLRRWDFVNVPAQAERQRLDEDGRLLPGWLPDSLGREPGEWLESARGRTPEDWTLRRAEVGEMAWGSLYQQHPTPPEGAIFGAEHITRNRRPDGWATAAVHRAVAVDPSAGGADEAGLVAGYRGKDGRAYLTHDRSERMTSAQWTRRAWLLVLDTDADALVWETNLVAPTFRAELKAAWARIVAQARLLAEVQEGPRAVAAVRPPDGDPDAPFSQWVRVIEPAAQYDPADRQAVLEEAAIRLAMEEQRQPRDAVEADRETVAQLAEVLDRMTAGLLSHRMETMPAKLAEVHASTGKRTRATPVAVAVETNAVSHVGVFSALELELTQWQEGQPSPGRLDAYVWLITHLLGVRRNRSFTAAAVTLPSASASR